MGEGGEDYRAGEGDRTRTYGTQTLGLGTTKCAISSQLNSWNERYSVSNHRQLTSLLKLRCGTHQHDRSSNRNSRHVLD